MTKPLLIALSLAVVSATGPAFAIERLTSTSLTCQQVRAIIERDGDAIVRYPSERTAGRTLFKRFVSSKRQCDNFERTIPFSVPTIDSPSCRLEICIDRSLRPRGVFED